jgi:hypothetical protein
MATFRRGVVVDLSGRTSMRSESLNGSERILDAGLLFLLAAVAHDEHIDNMPPI